MDYVKVIDHVDTSIILKEVKTLEKVETGQTPLQGAFAGDFEGAVGKTYDLRSDEHDYTFPLYDTMPYTYELLEKYNLHRTRLMKMKKKTCYSYHYDLTPRIHIPLISNNSCMFVIEDKVYRLPADGSVYLVDTTKYHTALNANREDFYRLHLVGNVESNFEDWTAL